MAERPERPEDLAAPFERAAEMSRRLADAFKPNPAFERFLAQQARFQEQVRAMSKIVQSIDLKYLEGLARQQGMFRKQVEAMNRTTRIVQSIDLQQLRGIVAAAERVQASIASMQAWSRAMSAQVDAVRGIASTPRGARSP